MTTTQERIVAGKDRYGAHLMIGEFRSAMPSIEVATQLAVAPSLIALVEGLLEDVANNDGGVKMNLYWQGQARAALAAAQTKVTA